LSTNTAAAPAAIFISDGPRLYPLMSAGIPPVVAGDGFAARRLETPTPMPYSYAHVERTGSDSQRFRRNARPRRAPDSSDISVFQAILPSLMESTHLGMEPRRASTTLGQAGDPRPSGRLSSNPGELPWPDLRSTPRSTGGESGGRGSGPLRPPLVPVPDGGITRWAAADRQQLHSCHGPTPLLPETPGFGEPRLLP
jgi:hypothetical protein